MRLARLVPLALVVTLTLAATAHAGTIAVIVAGEPAKQPVVETTLDPWLKAKGFAVEVGVSDVTVVNKLVDCFVLIDQSCAEAAVARLARDNTLFVMVEVSRDFDTQTDEVKLTGWLYGAGGKAVVAQSVFCRACRNDTLGPTVEDLAKALFAVAGQGAGVIKVTSTPPGARVLIDGVAAGTTPWEQGVRTGPHTITVELAGHRTETRPVEIVKDKTAELAIELTPGADPNGAGRRGPRDATWLGVAGGGAALMLAGAVMVAIDQDCAKNGPCDVAPSAKTFRDTGLAGALTLVGGAVVAGVGGYLYWTSGKQVAASPTAWIEPGRGGGLGLVGRF
ncbi:MAG: PEGA domain-containing protein [Kofleriaceae bacterium]